VANGLIGLDDDLWLIKQTSEVHVAATFLFGDGLVHFSDYTLDPEGGDTWVFWILEGDEQEAVELAGRLNIHPVAYIETGITPDDRGCGCGPRASGALWGLLLIVWVSRRCFLTSAG
jgi:hypothetical protein